MLDEYLLLILFSVLLVPPVCLALFMSTFGGSGIVEEGRCRRSVICTPPYLRGALRVRERVLQVFQKQAKM